MTKRTRNDKNTNDDKGIIEYPVSVNYRKEWKEWEAIREIVQNAMDNGSASYRINNFTSLIITDKGKGIGLKQLLIGESTKDGINSIGKFGEGLKFGLLALVRLGKKVEIQTNGLILTPGLQNMFGEETLTISWKKNPNPINGTKVTIHGIDKAEIHMERFLSLDLRDNLRQRILTEPKYAGELYIKGIYIKEIPSKVGYNLNMERENPMSGDVDMSKVEKWIARLLEQTNDRDVMSKMIRTYNEGQTRNIEYSAGTWMVWEMKHPVMWKQEAAKVFGTSELCTASDHDATTQAVYRGFKVLYDHCPFFEGFVKKDVEAVPEKKAKSENIGMKGLTSKEAANVRWARRLIEAAMDEKIKRLEIVKYLKEDGINVMAQGAYKRVIRLSPPVCASREKCLEVMLHEAVHYYYGSHDVTEGFINNLAELSQKVITLIISQKGKRTATPKPTSNVDHQEVYNQWMDIYTEQCIDSKTGKEIFNELNDRLELICTHMTTLYSVAKAFGAKGHGGKSKHEAIAIIADAIRDAYNNR